LGSDRVGDIIVDFLTQNNINTSYIHRYKEGQSALAMAFLNAQNDAEYEFYKNYPKVRLADNLPPFQKDDILLFGSFYAIDEQIREQVYKIVSHAKDCGCIILYDPNYRKKHHASLHLIEENMTMADIIRASNEDMMNLFGAEDSTQAYKHSKKHCPNLVYTANANGVYLQTSNQQKHYTVKPITPISTIGAGDNFNAGIIHAILKNNICKDDLSNLKQNLWDMIIESGISLSAEVCMSLDNYIKERNGER